jgi:pyruvate dehydrogenase E2 component (dihydrolipoamide acetyltransferase)
MIKGTGPGGRIIKADIEEAVASGVTSAPKAMAAAPELTAAPGEYVDLPNS